MGHRANRIRELDRKIICLGLRIGRDERPVYAVLDDIKRSAESCGDDGFIHRKRLGHGATERLGLAVIGAYDNIR